MMYLVNMAIFRGYARFPKHLRTQTYILYNIIPGICPQGNDSMGRGRYAGGALLISHIGIRLQGNQPQGCRR